MIEKAHAKINLSLDIKNLRDDGYHNLETIMLPLEMHDSLEVQILPIIDEAREKWGFREHFLINIHKNIFLQAGLGGGSADAGAALRAVIKLLKLKPKKEDLIDIGIAIGSDVPWAIFNSPTLLKRKGEVLEFFDHVAPFYVLLVKPFDGLSTKDVFEAADRCEDVAHGDINLIKDLYLKDDLEGLGNNVFNSLENPAIELLPSISNIIENLRDDGFECVRMSGSGSCVFALTNNKKLWRRAEKKYTLDHYQVCATKFLGK